MLYQGIIGGGSSPVEPVDLSPVLLWTNPNPSSNFTAQTVSVDLTNYSGVIVEFNKTDTSKIVASRVYAKKTDDLSIFGCGFIADTAIARNILAVNNTGVQFGNVNTGTEVCIPYKIYGVKEYVVEPYKPVDATLCERAYNFPTTSGTTNTWTVEEDGLYLIAGDAPGFENNRGSISFIGEATLISGNDGIRVFTAKAGAQVKLTVTSGNTFTPYINIIK